MEQQSIQLASGDTVFIRGMVTRALEKEITKRSFKNVKLVRSTQGQWEVDNIDMSDNDEVNDFVVLSMIEKITKADGVNVPATPEYVAGMVATEFAEVLKAARAVLKPKKDEEEKAEKKS